MQIKKMKIADLKPAPYNPRTSTKQQEENLKASLEKFGVVEPVIYNKQTGHIVGGHFRVRELKKLGHKEIDCVIVDLNEADEKELNIRLNANTGDFDWERLANEWNADDLLDWGLKIPNFEPETLEAEEDDFDVPEIESIKTSIKYGDLIEIGQHRLLCGDSTKEEDVKKLMNGKLADMVFTDAPYGVSYTGGVSNTKHGLKSNDRQMIKNDDVDLYDKAIPMMASITKGAIYAWFADTKARSIYQAIEDCGGEIHALIVWVKNGGYGALNANYKQKHEPCLYWKPKGGKLNFTGETTETTIWEINKDGQNKLHPTQKPVSLAFKAINNHSAKIVADLFLGSGSTMVAAHQLKRICYGIELDEKYCQVIIDRVLNLEPSISVLVNGKKYKPEKN